MVFIYIWFNYSLVLNVFYFKVSDIRRNSVLISVNSHYVKFLPNFNRVISSPSTSLPNTMWGTQPKWWTGHFIWKLEIGNGNKRWQVFNSFHWFWDSVGCRCIQPCTISKSEMKNEYFMDSKKVRKTWSNLSKRWMHCKPGFKKCLIEWIGSHPVFLPILF